jgi:gas vesicle protein
MTMTFALVKPPQPERRLNAMTETRGFNGLQLLIAFATGAAAGAAVAYMTAPRTGKEARAAMQGWAKDARTKASRIPQAVREAVERGTQAGKEAFAQSYRSDSTPADS